MRIRRDISSVPVRSAKETWRAIIELVTGPDSVARDQLDAASSIMEAIIADEQPAGVPIVFKGAGPRVLIYCRYNEDAMEAGSDIDKLTTNPTTDGWRMTAPSEKEDVEWMNRSLKSKAPRISIYDVNEPPSDEEEETKQQAGASVEIDWGALTKS